MTLPPDLAALCTPRLDHLGPLAVDPVPEAPTIGLASAGRALIDPRSARSGLYTTFAREVEPTIPALVSGRNPYGTERVAAILRRLDRMRPGASLEPDEAPCANGCGRSRAARVVRAEAWERRGPGSGGRRPLYCGPECERQAHNARRKAARVSEQRRSA